MPKIHPRNKKELVSSHYYIHAFYNQTKRGVHIKNWPMNKIRLVHAYYVTLFKKYGMNHNSPLK